MHAFSKDLLKTATELAQDEANILDAIGKIRDLQLIVPNVYEALLKGNWVFHKQRLWLISSRQSFKNHEFNISKQILTDNFKICFKKFRVLNGDRYSYYAALIPLLKQDPSLLANVMHMYTHAPFIFERLSASVVCSLANFSLDSSNSVFLYSLLKELLSISSKSGSTGSPFLKELHSSFPMRFFIEGLPDSRRYLSALLCDIVNEISLHNYPAEENYVKRCSSSPKSRSVFYCANACSFQSPSDILVFVNILINNFKQTVPLFPQSCLLWLHSLRQTLRNAGASESTLHKTTVDHILSFVTRALLNPELFLVSGPYLDPTGHRVLTVLTSALNFLAHIDDHNALPAESVLTQFFSETGIQAAKLLQVCDARKLQLSINSVIDIADRVSLVAFAPLDCSVHADETNLSDLHNATSATRDYPTQSIFMTTPTDFNILVDCLRLYLQKNTEGFDEIRNILLRLPTRVPGSFIGIQPRQNSNGYAESGTRAINTDNQPYQLVYYDPSSPDETPLKGRNKSLRLTRSRSASRLGVVRAARVAQTDSSSLGRSKSPSSSSAVQSLDPFDIPFCATSHQTVLILQLGNACTSPQPHILSELEFRASRRTLRSGDSDSIRQPHTDPTKLTKANGPFHQATPGTTVACHGDPISQSQSSSSGSSRSSGDAAVENAANGDADMDDCEDDVDGGDSSPMRVLHFTRLRCRVQAPSIDEQCSQNGLLMDGSTEDLMAEDRSINDPSSDASERSGFTSLASSAHAMRVRVVGAGLHASTRQSRGSVDCEAPPTTSIRAHDLSANHGGTMTAHTCHAPGTVQQFAVEKRARFSQAVLCNEQNAVTGLEPIARQSESNAPCQPRDHHSTQGSLEGNDAAALSSNRSADDVMHALARARTVPRSGSVDLVHTCRPGAVGYTGQRSGGTNLAPTDRQTNHSDIDGSIPGSPSAVRYSSLNCLPVPRSTSLAVNNAPGATTVQDSLQTPATFEYVNEAEERFSGITCSSCGVRFSETADDARQRDLSTEGSQGDAELQAQLDDSQLARRLGDRDQEVEEEEDALSDLPDLSSANVSGRATPLSLTSSTSHGGGGAPSSTTGPLLGDSPNIRGHAYNRAGFVLPNGASLAPSTAAAVAAAAASSSQRAAIGQGHHGSVRFGMLDFPASLLHTHVSPDVTDKFGKFDLPVTRMPEAEARSTVSDTWSTDVLPSDTEYPDGGSEYLGPESSVNAVTHNHHLQSDHEHHEHHHHHRHHHHHHCRGPRSVAHRADCAETGDRDAEEVSPRNRHRESPNGRVPHEDRSGSYRSAFPTSMHDNDASPPSEFRPSVERATLVPPATLESPSGCDQTPPASTAQEVSGRTAITAALTVSMLDSTAVRSSSPALTPLGVSCETEVQSAVLPVNQTGLTNRVPKPMNALLEGYSRLKDRIDLIARRSNGTRTDDRTSENRAATAENDQILSSVRNADPTCPDPPLASDQHGPIPSTISSGFSQSKPSTSTDSPQQVSVQRPSDTQPTTASGDRSDETVDEMMERYRRQSNTKLSQPMLQDRSGHGKSHPSTTVVNTATTSTSSVHGGRAIATTTMADSVSANRGATCGSWSSSTPLPSGSDQLRALIVRGLRRIFSNPLIPSVLEPISCQLMTAGFASLDTGYPGGFSRQDVFFLTLLDALMSDALIYQDTGLTTCIRETKRLLERLLLNIHLVSRAHASTSQRQSSAVLSWADNPTSRNNQLQSSMECDAVVTGLLRQLRAERRHRLAYLAYLMEQQGRIMARKRSLSVMRRRCERDLQVQCEYIVHKCVSTFLDSQLETFQSFYARFAEQRNHSETDNRGTVSCGDSSRSGDISIAAQLTTQLIDDLIQKWESIEPARRPPILLPVARLGPGQEDVDADFTHLASSHLLFARMHIRRLVMEKVYQSGVWMNDASLERESDRVLHRELALLSRVITLSELQVPERFHAFEPFHSVQEELRKLNWSHLPSDMMLCLKRVMERIVATLQLACPDSAPSADDLLPVLIFVILQVNPPRLLTNMSFLDLFLDRLDGEDQYVWCQFRSAVSEIRRLLSVVQLDSD